MKQVPHWQILGGTIQNLAAQATWCLGSVQSAISLWVIIWPPFCRWWNRTRKKTFLLYWSKYGTFLVTCYDLMLPFVALANILENTALFGDILLRLPDISHKILTSKYEWKVLLLWSLGFSNQTHLLDKQTEKLVYLVSF